MTCFDCKRHHEKCKSQCCGTTPINKKIFKMNKVKRNRKVIKILSIGPDVLPVTQDGFCTFLQDDLSCGIYDYRPFECREYGSEINFLMTCPYQDKNGRSRDWAEELLVREKIHLEMKMKINKMKNEL